MKILALWILLIIIACSSISIDTIDTCSIEQEKFAGTSYLTRINCSNKISREARELTQSQAVVDRWVGRAEAVKEEAQRIEDQVDDLGLEDEIDVDVDVDIEERLQQ